MIFMEKFHSCYRDGLDGGRDMRIFSSLYFVLRIILVCAPKLIVHFCTCTVWFPRGILLTIAAVVVALSRPYKKTYVTISNTLLLTHASVICYILSSNSYNVYFVPSMQVILLFPFIILTLAVLLKLVKKLRGIRLLSLCKAYLLKTWTTIGTCRYRLQKDNNNSEYVAPAEQSKKMDKVNNKYGSI